MSDWSGVSNKPCNPHPHRHLIDNLDLPNRVRTLQVFIEKF